MEKQPRTLEQRKESIAFLEQRVMKHLEETFTKMSAYEPAKDSLDITRILFERLVQEIDEYFAELEKMKRS